MERKKEVKLKLKTGESIKKQILKTILVLIVAALVFLGVTSIVLNIVSLNSSMKKAMTETAQVAAESVSHELMAYQAIVAELGCTARLSSSAVSDEDKQAVIDQKVATYGFVRGKLINADGIALDGTDYNDRDYFKASMQGETCITEPLMAKTTGKLSIIISAPVWKGGIAGSEVVGVVFVVPEETMLNDIVAAIQVSKNGSAYMLDKTGNTIAHKDMTLVETQSNTIKEAETDSSLKKIAALESKMILGEGGSGTYRYGGKLKLMGYAPIENTNGWSMAVVAPMSDFMGATYVAIAVVVAQVIGCILFTLFLVTRLAAKIGDPIRKCADRLVLLAEGDLTTAVPEEATNQESGALIAATKEIVGGMNTIIGDVKYLLDAMADGNFDIKSKATGSYVGDFEGILLAVRNINYRLSDTLTQIQQAAEQVNMGAEQMAEGAQSLAEGATDQAASVEELLATVEDVTTGRRKAPRAL